MRVYSRIEPLATGPVLHTCLDGSVADAIAEGQANAAGDVRADEFVEVEAEAEPVAAPAEAEAPVEAAASEEVAETVTDSDAAASETESSEADKKE